jgi:hypothetical protein
MSLLRIAASSLIAMIVSAPLSSARADLGGGELFQAWLTFMATHGNADCRQGDAACNVCAVTVAAQFADTFHGDQAGWKSKPYSFNWNNHYMPGNVTPREVFYDGKVIQHEHVQGFVRTNSALYPFAGSYADDKQGAFFFVHQDEKGVKTLSALATANGAHPSGVHTIGNYLVGAEGDFLRLFALDQAASAQNVRYPVTVGKPLASAGGGLGVAELVNGGHLLVSSPDGGTHPTVTRFHRLSGDLTDPSIEYLGETSDAPWDAYLEHALGRSFKSGDWQVAAENLSLITECGTGDLYVIHATGDEDVVGNVLDDTDGIWRLSKVSWSDMDTPQLVPVDFAVVSQTRSDCHLRSSATVHADEQNRLIFYCHERSARETVTQGAKMHFKVGTPYSE